MNSQIEQPDALLSRVTERLSSGDHSRGMHDLFSGLLEVRDRVTSERWREFSQNGAMAHPLREAIHLDPMCRHSFDKPRGYAGDAVLLDYIYRIRSVGEAPPLGRAVHEYAVNRPAACAVRHRRDWLAYALDRTVDQCGRGARVMSIACGHLREAELSAAVQQGWLSELVAVDADAQSLEVAVQANPDIVTPAPISIGRLLGRAEAFGKFNFVYSAGLYDYLEPRVATRLTNCMFSMLEPGGRLMFSNFLPQVLDAGYMESYMGWELIYRSQEDLRSLLEELPTEEIAEIKVYDDPYDAIGYVEVQRT